MDSAGNGCPASTDCGLAAAGIGPDLVWLWTPTQAGCYQLDTNGSAYDTVLRIYPTCEGVEIVCDDDAGDGLDSLLEFEPVVGTDYPYHTLFAE